MTDDPAIPQQGPMETWLRAKAQFSSAIPRNTELRSKAREFDTAFAALESALRDCKEAMTTLRGDEKCEHEADLCWCGWKIFEDDANAALALAEAVRKGDA